MHLFNYKLPCSSSCCSSSCCSSSHCSSWRSLHCSSLRCSCWHCSSLLTAWFTEGLSLFFFPVLFLKSTIVCSAFFLFSGWLRDFPSHSLFFPEKQKQKLYYFIKLINNHFTETFQMLFLHNYLSHMLTITIYRKAI